jgi:uncharacterized membrane protein
LRDFWLICEWIYPNYYIIIIITVKENIPKRKGGEKMNSYEVLRETTVIDIVAIIKADSLEEAKQKAKEMGYDKTYRVEEMEG